MRGEDGQLETLGKFRGMIRGNGRLLNGHDARSHLRSLVTRAGCPNSVDPGYPLCNH